MTGRNTDGEEYSGVFLDEIVWKLVNKLIAELLRTNKMSMLTILTSAAANQTTTAVTNVASGVLNVATSGGDFAVKSVIGGTTTGMCVVLCCEVMCCVLFAL